MFGGSLPDEAAVEEDLKETEQHEAKVEALMRRAGNKLVVVQVCMKKEELQHEKEGGRSSRMALIQAHMWGQEPRHELEWWRRPKERSCSSRWRREVDAKVEKRVQEKKMMMTVVMM